MNQVMSKFQVNAADYGLLSSMYYFGYAGAQLPVAFLLDRFGPRKVISLSALLCSLGVFIFAYSHQWNLILGARFLIGVGSAAGFLGAAKVVSQWFSSDQYGRMVGLTVTFGLFGAVYGGKPVATWIASEGWLSVFSGLGWLCLSVGILIALFLKDSGPYSVQQTPPQFKDVQSILQNRKIVLLAFCNLLMVGPLEGFADVWGVTYFIKAYALAKPDAAWMISLIFMGMLVGGPLLAFIAEKLNKYFEVTAFCGFASAVIFALILGVLNSYHPILLGGLMFTLGILCCYQVLVFAIGSRLTPSSLLSTTTAFLNSINMLGGSFFHGTIGLILNFFWIGGETPGVQDYSMSQYRIAIAVIPTACVLGGLGLLMIRLFLYTNDLSASKRESC
jgi:MFS family permease